MIDCGQNQFLKTEAKTRGLETETETTSLETPCFRAYSSHYAYSPLLMLYYVQFYIIYVKRH